MNRKRAGIMIKLGSVRVWAWSVLLFVETALTLCLLFFVLKHAYLGDLFPWSKPSPSQKTK